ncbi:hypothetical protein MATL_G00127530 [Megalops atlanticus]|uniref:Uncharacterized protein n=1 Tax=Megalops atlanticus TaxID=7932 RepID=A0A9D3PZI6_MEGAT|nr:hypothetical protein MATL_G00127530 [Megalops atlanticus]
MLVTVSILLHLIIFFLPDCFSRPTTGKLLRPVISASLVSKEGELDIVSALLNWEEKLPATTPHNDERRIPALQTTKETVTARTTLAFGTSASHKSNETPTLPVSQTTEETSPASTARATLTSGTPEFHQSTFTARATLTSGTSTFHQSNTSSHLTSKYPAPKAQNYEQMIMGVGTAAGMVLLGMTAICICRTQNKKKSQRQQTDALNSAWCGSVDVGNVFNVYETIDMDGTYSLITSVPSTFKPLPSGSPVNITKSSSDTPGQELYSFISKVPVS